MCGRFLLLSDAEALKERFQIGNIEELDIPKRYNIAPTQDILAVVRDGKANKAGYLRWGLVPSWAKEPSIGSKMINARAETLDEKPSFRRLLQQRRCVIVADGFYEWDKKDGIKQPFRITLEHEEPFAFAGLWDRWEKNGKIITSCTIITTTANKKVEPIHDRMPVILSKENESLWLDKTITDIELLKQLLIPYPDDKMKMYEVSNIVNSAKIDTPECITSINRE